MILNLHHIVASFAISKFTCKSGRSREVRTHDCHVSDTLTSPTKVRYRNNNDIPQIAKYAFSSFITLGPAGRLAPTDNAHFWEYKAKMLPSRS